MVKTTVIWFLIDIDTGNAYYFIFILLPWMISSNAYQCSSSFVAWLILNLKSCHSLISGGISWHKHKMLLDDTVGIYYNMIPYSVSLQKAPKGLLHQIDQTHKRQSLVHPHRWVMGCLLCVFRRHLTMLQQVLTVITSLSQCVFLLGWNENLNAGCCQVCWCILSLFGPIVYSGAVVYVVHAINHPDVSIKKTNIVCCWMTLACMTLKWKSCHFVEIISGCTESCHFVWGQS